MLVSEDDIERRMFEQRGNDPNYVINGTLEENTKRYVNQHYPFMLPLGRPSMFTDKQFNFWITIHNWMKTSDAEIVPNGMFYRIDEMLKNKLKYGGGGFSYNFWFKTFDDVEQFFLFINQKLGGGGYVEGFESWHRIRLRWYHDEFNELQIFITDLVKTIRNGVYVGKVETHLYDKCFNSSMCPSLPYMMIFCENVDDALVIKMKASNFLWHESMFRKNV